MKPRVIVCLFHVLVFILIADSAFGATKIVPRKGKAGGPFTIIDTPHKRLIAGSVAVFRSEEREATLPLRINKSRNTAHGRLPTGMYGGKYTVFVRQPDGTEIEVGRFKVFGPTALPPLITPYKFESDIINIRDGFSTISDPKAVPWGFVHDGIDIYPKYDLTKFQAVCSGRVHWMYIGSEQVTVMLACDSTYTAEYNFETQSPQTGHIQLDYIDVYVGQVVSQGRKIGSLLIADPEAHVHFSFHKNWIPSCPEPYFSPAAESSMLNLLHEKYPNADLCYGGNVTPPPLVTPYINESEVAGIYAGFSAENTFSPWGFASDGLDIYPQGDQQLFRASCSGAVDTVELQQEGPGSNWQVKVLIQCEDYVYDPQEGGYFIPFSVEYIFHPMSNIPSVGEGQRTHIAVSEGDLVSQGADIGILDAAIPGAHVHFRLVQYGSSEFSALGVQGIPLCPEPHFSAAGRNSILNLLHVVWPNAEMCYQNQN